MVYTSKLQPYEFVGDGTAEQEFLLACLQKYDFARFEPGTEQQVPTAPRELTDHVGEAERTKSMPSTILLTVLSLLASAHAFVVPVAPATVRATARIIPFPHMSQNSLSLTVRVSRSLLFLTAVHRALRVTHDAMGFRRRWRWRKRA